MIGHERGVVAAVRFNCGNDVFAMLLAVVHPLLARSDYRYRALCDRKLAALVGHRNSVIALYRNAVAEYIDGNDGIIRRSHVGLLAAANGREIMPLALKQAAARAARRYVRNAIDRQRHIVIDPRLAVRFDRNGTRHDLELAVNVFYFIVGRDVFPVRRDCHRKHVIRRADSSAVVNNVGHLRRTVRLTYVSGDKPVQAVGRLRKAVVGMRFAVVYPSAIVRFYLYGTPSYFERARCGRIVDRVIFGNVFAVFIGNFYLYRICDFGDVGDRSVFDYRKIVTEFFQKTVYRNVGACGKAVSRTVVHPRFVSSRDESRFLHDLERARLERDRVVFGNVVAAV